MSRDSVSPLAEIAAFERPPMLLHSGLPSSKIVALGSVGYESCGRQIGKKHVVPRSLYVVVRSYFGIWYIDIRYTEVSILGRDGNQWVPFGSQILG